MHLTQVAAVGGGWGGSVIVFQMTDLQIPQYGSVPGSLRVCHLGILEFLHHAEVPSAPLYSLIRMGCTIGIHWAVYLASL